MWPDRVSNPGPLTYESGALPTALRGPANLSQLSFHMFKWKIIVLYSYILAFGFKNNLKYILRMKYLFDSYLTKTDKYIHYLQLTRKRRTLHETI